VSSAPKEDLPSLRRQLAEARENLRLIQERKGEFVLSTDVPLQLVKEERRWLDKIAELEQRLAAQSSAREDQPRADQKRHEPEAPTTTGHVFISYGREDQAYARDLAADLRAHGLGAWMDDRIDFGDRWWQTIVQAVRASAAVIVVMTPAAEQSEWVERELMLALNEGKPIFPLLLRGKCFPILLNKQFANVSGGQMPPDSFYERLARIVPSNTTS
jgi:nucleotide-binding universal stress UspA family protein